MIFFQTILLLALNGLSLTEDCPTSGVFFNFKGISDYVQSDSTICNTTIPWWVYHDKVKSIEAKDLITWARSVIPEPSEFKHPSSCWDGPYNVKLLSKYAAEGKSSPTSLLKNVEQFTSKHEICIPTVHLLSFDDMFSLDRFLTMAKHPEISLPLNNNTKWYNGDALKNPSVMLTFKIDLLTYLANFNYESKKISVDSSSTLIWKNNRAMDLCTIPTFVHGINPSAKFIVLMKAPWTNTYHNFIKHSAVKFLNTAVPSDMEWFHRCVTSQIMWFSHCLSTGASLGTCAYDIEMVNWDRLFGFCHFNIGASLYYIHLRRWLSVYSNDQFLFLRMEDLAEKPHNELQKVWKFLDLETPLEHSTHQPFTIEDTIPKKHYPMLDETKVMLRKFFEPFNIQLSKLIGNTDYLWKSY